jgi:hypothetical protein
MPPILPIRRGVHRPCTGARRRISPLDGSTADLAGTHSGLGARSAGKPRRFPARRPTRMMTATGAVRLWKLPELWTHRTRPQAPWKPQNGFHSSHSHCSLFSLQREPMVRGYRETDNRSCRYRRRAVYQILRSISVTRHIDSHEVADRRADTDRYECRSRSRPQRPQARPGSNARCNSGRGIR